MKKTQGVVDHQGSTYDPFESAKMSGMSASAEGSRKVDQNLEAKTSVDAEDEDRVLDSVVGAPARSETGERRVIPEVAPSVIAAKGSPAAQQAPQSETTASETPKKAEHRRDRKRQIKKGVFVDVFDVIRAFGVTCPAQMAVLTDLLMADPKDLEEHYLILLDAQDNLKRAIELMGDEMGIQFSLE